MGKEKTACSLKARLFIGFLAAIMLGLTSCTTNGGDLDGLWGQWRVEDIVIDGSPDNDYNGNLYFSFQNYAVRVTEVIDEDMGSSRGTLGTFVFSRPDLVITFGMPEYAPLKSSHMVAGDNHVSVADARSGHMTWTFSTDGVEYIFKLKQNK